jgi:hypothetical protein
MVTPGMCAIKVNSCGSTLTPGAGSPYTGVPAETGCSTANFTAVGNNATYDYSATPYYYNSTATNSGGYSNYQAVPFESDYRTSDSTTFADPNSPWGALNYLSPSKLVNATWFYQCSGHTFPGDSGGDEQYGMEDPGGAGTYYADAILQAQNTFNAPAAGQIGAGRSNVGHAIIMLSDGDATSGVTDHSKLDTAGTNECQAGINAAMTAEAAGVEFFSVAYGAVTSGCATDTSVIGNVGGTTCYATANLSTNISTDCTARSPLCAMELMADNPQTDSAYNSLYAAEQALCTGPNAYADDPSHHFFNAPTGADFQKAFQAVGVQLTSSRLVPDTAN